MASIKVDKDSKYIKRIFYFIYSTSFSLAEEEYNMPDQSFYISEDKKFIKFYIKSAVSETTDFDKILKSILKDYNLIEKDDDKYELMSSVEYMNNSHYISLECNNYFYVKMLKTNHRRVVTKIIAFNFRNDVDFNIFVKNYKERRLWK